MRTLYCLALLAILLPATAAAQPGTNHPFDPSASILGTFASSVVFPDNGNPDGGDTSMLLTTVKDREVGGHTNVCVWRLSNGSVEYMIKDDSIGVTGTWDTGDSLSMEEFFDELARAVVAQGVARGFTPCVTTGRTTARVLVPSCVSRSGSGSTRRLTPCGPGVCARTFEISCANGVTTIALVPTPPHGPVCTQAGCESTCR